MDISDQYTSCTVNAHSVNCFASLSVDETDYLNSRSVIIHYKKGEVITKRGGFASHVMYLVHGLVKSYIEDGINSLVLKIVSPDTLFGLTALGEGNNVFQYSTSAYIDSQIRQIEMKAFNEVLMNNPKFSREVISTLSASNTQINGRFFCLTHKQSYGRMADILLCLTERIFKSHVFTLPLSRKELAELTGMSEETVIRLLKKFHNEGLIHIKSRQISIVDYLKLKKIGEAG